MHFFAEIDMRCSNAHMRDLLLGSSCAICDANLMGVNVIQAKSSPCVMLSYSWYWYRNDTTKTPLQTSR